jgi:hypothetical protein
MDTMLHQEDTIQVALECGPPRYLPHRAGSRSPDLGGLLLPQDRAGRTLGGGLRRYQRGALLQWRSQRL